jgi:hypothetical protein
VADKTIDIPGIGPVDFPDSMSDAQMNAAATRLYQNANVGKKQPPVTSWTAAPESDSGALIAKGAAAAVPVAANAAAELATNPNVPKAAAAAGRLVGAIAPTVAGGAAGGPVGALAGAANAAKGAWAGGKTGWFTGKLAQEIAAPVASVAEKVAPYAQAASTVAGAQGVNDLAQMAEPKRQDIGFMGMASPGSASDQAAVMKSQIANLVKSGTPIGEATRTVYNAWAKFLRDQQAK